MGNKSGFYLNEVVITVISLAVVGSFNQSEFSKGACIQTPYWQFMSLMGSLQVPHRQHTSTSWANKHLTGNLWAFQATYRQIMGSLQALCGQFMGTLQNLKFEEYFDLSYLFCVFDFYSTF